MALHRSRPLLLVAGLAAASLALGGCAAEGSSSADGAQASGDWQTVEIENALGTATIEERPERIVTLGQGSTETAIALGTVPVSMEEYPWGSDETGYLPWIYDAVTESGEELPEQFTGATELDTEAILALEPDLVLAPWSGITQEQYDELSGFVPVVAYPEQPWTIEWQQQIEIIGEAMGQEDDAADLIAGIEEQFEAAAVPEYEGLTYSFIYTQGPGTLGMFYPEEQRSAVVSALGLTPDPVVEDMRSEFDVPGTQSAMIGLENADELDDSDLIFTFYSDEASRDEITAQDLYASIPAIERGSVVAPEDQPFVTGSSIINPLTVPWALERYKPMIDEAIAQLDK